MPKDHMKGKTYEELYGEERAAELRANRAESNRRRKGLSTRAKGVPRPKFSEYKRAWWASKTPEERKELSRKWQEAGTIAATSNHYWDSLSEEQKILSLQRLNKGRSKNKRTRIELLIEQELTDFGVEFQSQYRLGRYQLDFFLPTLNIDLECDGDYWHSIPEIRQRDRTRDEYMLEKSIEVIRITEHDIYDGAPGLVARIMDKMSWIS